jgi:hypothetical protein
VPAEIRQFFEQYRDAFNRLDGDAVARLYAIPSGIAHDKGYTHWPAFEPVRDNMVALCQLYRSNGFESARFEPGAFVPMGDRFALADVAWRVDRHGGQEPWEFRTSYNLMKTDDGWRILLCTAYEEKRLNA